MSRGHVTYVTTAHVARCADCPWQSRPLAADAPQRTKSKPEAIRNIQAAKHARQHRHRVLVEIHREFDRRLDRPDSLDCLGNDEPLCDRCDASFREDGDALCAACRADVDSQFGDLPGAGV